MTGVDFANDDRGAAFGTPDGRGFAGAGALVAAFDPGRTFRNDSVVDNVAVFLNPAQAKTPWAGYALVFERKELQREHPELLESPLGVTLPDTRRTLMPSQLDANHVARIDSLTLPYLYLYRYKILGGRDALMQLQPTNTNS